MYDLHKETDETHDQEADAGGAGNLRKFCSKIKRSAFVRTRKSIPALVHFLTVSIRLSAFLD
jgi:hypothetical protein